jgi:hypothetical protein
MPIGSAIGGLRHNLDSDASCSARISERRKNIAAASRRGIVNHVEELFTLDLSDYCRNFNGLSPDLKLDGLMFSEPRPMFRMLKSRL